MKKILKLFILTMTLIIILGPIVNANAAVPADNDGLEFMMWGPTKITLSNINVNTAPNASNTVQFWMKWDGRTNTMPLSFNGADYDLTFASSNCFGFNTVMGDCIGVNPQGFINKWVHVVAVFINGTPNTSNVKLYINGVNQNLTFTTSAYSPVNRTVSKELRISGYKSYDGTEMHFFPGRIKDLAIWNRELTPSEIMTSYTNGVVGNEVDLVGYWNLDSVTTSQVFDKSLYKNHGVSEGFSSGFTLNAANITDLGLSLNWNGLNSASGYELKRGNVLIYDGPNINYKENALESETAYSYKVIAKNQNGRSTPVSAEFTTNPGSLELLSVPADISLTSVTLNGEIQKSYGTFTDKLMVKDTRKVRDGWHLVAQATNLSGGNRTFPNEKLQLQPVSSIVQTAGLMKNTPVVINQKQTIDSGISKTLIQADPNNTGFGIYEISLPPNALELTINPENAYKNNYMSNITWSVVPGIY